MEINSRTAQVKVEYGLNAPRRDFKGSKTPDLSSRQVKLRNLEPVTLRKGRIQKNTRNRRSISDPNIPRSFIEVKKLWAEKIQSGLCYICYNTVSKQYFYEKLVKLLTVFNS